MNLPAILALQDLPGSGALFTWVSRDSPFGLARAFAWACDRWSDRHLITALLEDPDPIVALS